jgi:putative membrane protein
MKRAKFDDAAREALTGCVKKIETTTDAELVLVVRARSGSYRQADYLFGALFAFAGLLFLLFSPFDFHQYWVAIDVALLFAIGAVITSRSNSLRRLLTTEKFRSAAVRTGAAAMFYEAGIANTSAEMGVLIYLSVLERRLELIADRGILKGVNALEWNQLLFELHEAGHKADAATLQAGLENLGVLLSKHLPATGENPNELPDAPRFELK